MYGHVTEDGSAVSCSTPSLSGSPVKDVHAAFASPRRVCSIAAVAAIILAGWVQPAGAQDETLRATVREIDVQREWLHIPLNKSVVIESNLPAVRQQTLSPEIAQITPISPTQILVEGKSIGRTQVIIWSADGQQQIFEVSVELELDLLKQAIEKIDPMASVDAVPILETVVLTGTASDADAAERIYQVAQIFVPNVQNQLQVAGQQQIMLKVKVAEVSKSATRQLGINGYLFGDNFKDIQVVNNIGQVNPSFITRPPARVDVDVPFVAPAIQTGMNPTLVLGLPDIQTQIFIQAMRDDGLLRVLAEPTLTTISGRTAAFLAGGEFPIPIPQTGAGTAGATAITVEYKEFGVRLAFTPIVLANQRIRLQVAPEVSELDFSQGVSFSGFVIPGLNSRRAETTVELGSGQTMAIGGLLSENFRATSSKIPGLGQVPILGALFRSVQFQKQVTDLVILVTPNLVGPLNPDEVGPAPGEELVAPNDYELYMLGLLEPEQYHESYQYTDEELEKAAEEMDDNAQASLLGPYGQADHAESE